MISIKAPAWVIDSLLLPLVLCVAGWVRAREATVLRAGVPLAADELALARTVGVAMPERVRVMPVNVVPMPLPRMLRRLAERFGWLSPHIVGMTLGYGVVLRGDLARDRGLLAHELTHVAQYERLGRFYGFLNRYIRECLWPGYPHGALEIEATRAETTARRRIPVSRECDTVRCQRHG
jgi:hypothetical protein